MAGHQRIEPESEAETDQDLDPRLCLPENLRIPISGQHFYKFGFSMNNNGFSGRKAIYHPVLTFVVPTILIVRYGWSTVTTTDTMSRHFHLMIGDFGYFMGLKSHLNATAFLVFFLAVFSNTILNVNYYMGKPEHFMAVFNMMCGRISPASVGLTNRTTIKTILNKSRLAFKVLDYARCGIISLSFFCSLFAFAFTVSWLELILIGEFRWKFLCFLSLIISSMKGCK